MDTYLGEVLNTSLLELYLFLSGLVTPELDILGGLLVTTDGAGGLESVAGPEVISVGVQQTR